MMLVGFVGLGFAGFRGKRLCAPSSRGLIDLEEFNDQKAPRDLADRVFYLIVSTLPDPVNAADRRTGGLAPASGAGGLGQCRRCIR